MITTWPDGGQLRNENKKILIHLYALLLSYNKRDVL